ncbi:flippase-like domain-containing protein [Methanospirillum purgamenti]|uniref:Flippase-like domain-containing protein n=1 Tax=Methanospirillum hungatei TaxID=2203 RepID=A0A8F5VID4_METHU|nr:lysylphosphatidylglycerol synthase transmembrane domain-containing protein [Methanospirillum hungatei]QXO93527.1 flippase-like domain-containing protein [Methanospirillum hungatei]
MKKITIFGIILSFFFIVLCFKNFNLEEFISSLSNVNIILIFAAAAFFLFSYILRGIRWQIMLKSVKNIQFTSIFCVLFVGFMANTFLPLRLGEFVRAYLIGIKENISKIASLSSIILERIFDGIILVLFLSILLIIYPFPEWVRNLGVFTSSLFFGGIIIILISTYYQSKTITLVSFFLFFLPGNYDLKIKNCLEKLFLGLGMLKNGCQTFFTLICSILIWLIEACVYFILLMAFNISNSSLFFIAIFTMIIINFGIMIPSSPGNIGTYHYFGIMGLTAFGINSNTAFAYTIVANAMMFVCIVVSGIISTWYLGISLSVIKKEIDPSE